MCNTKTNVLHLKYIFHNFSLYMYFYFLLIWVGNKINTLFYVESVGSGCPNLPSQRLTLKTFDEFQIELELIKNTNLIPVI